MLQQIILVLRRKQQKFTQNKNDKKDSYEIEKKERGNQWIIKMKKLLYILTLFLLLGCSKEEEVVLGPVLEISLDGESFDPYERYIKIETFGGSKWVDGKLKKIFILYLQVDDGEPRLDGQHLPYMF